MVVLSYLALRKSGSLASLTLQDARLGTALRALNHADSVAEPFSESAPHPTFIQSVPAMAMVCL